MANNQEITKLIKECVKDGWRLERGKRHYKLYHPVTGKMVTVSVSPSCCYAVKNIMGDIRRCSR